MSEHPSATAANLRVIDGALQKMPYEEHELTIIRSTLIDAIGTLNQEAKRLTNAGIRSFARLMEAYEAYWFTLQSTTEDVGVFLPAQTAINTSIKNPCFAAAMFRLVADAIGTRLNIKLIDPDEDYIITDSDPGILKDTLLRIITVVTSINQERTNNGLDPIQLWIGDKAIDLTRESEHPAESSEIHHHRPLYSIRIIREQTDHAPK